MQTRYKIVEKEKGIKQVTYLNQHWYSIPDELEPMPSVTTILGIISKGLGYDQWLKDVGENASLINERASDMGIRIHNNIERLVQGDTISVNENPMEFVTEREWKRMENWVRWYNELEITPYLLENTVWSPEYKVAGTFDMVAKIKDDKGEENVWLLDWKTGNNIYETSKLQVAAYYHWYNALVDCGYFTTPKANKTAIVHIGAGNKTRKGLNNVGIKVEEVEDVLHDYTCFLDALALFRRFNPDMKCPSQTYPAQLSINTKGVIKYESN